MYKKICTAYTENQPIESHCHFPCQHSCIWKETFDDWIGKFYNYQGLSGFGICRHQIIKRRSSNEQQNCQELLRGPQWGLSKIVQNRFSTAVPKINLYNPSTFSLWALLYLKGDFWGLKGSAKVVLLYHLFVKGVFFTKKRNLRQG